MDIRKTEEVLNWARLHHEQGRSTREIAEGLDVSRATVDRLLREARKNGLFRVRVVTASDSNELSGLADELRELFNQLIDVQITVGSQSCYDINSGDYHRRNVLDSVSVAGAHLLSRYLQELEADEIVGVGPGDMVKRTVAKVRVPNPLPKLKIVPITGYQDPRFTEVSANHIGNLLSQKVGSQFHWLPVVGIVEIDDYGSATNLPVVRDTLQKIEKASVILTSIGAIDADFVKNLRDGRNFLSRTHLSQYIKSIRGNRRPIGMIGSQIFDKHGKDVESPLMSIGVSLQHLRDVVRDKTGKVLVVGGVANTKRIRALHAALKGRLCNAIVLDHITALEVIRYAKSTKY